MGADVEGGIEEDGEALCFANSIEQLPEARICSWKPVWMGEHEPFQREWFAGVYFAIFVLDMAFT